MTGANRIARARPAIVQWRAPSDSLALIQLFQKCRRFRQNGFAPRIAHAIPRAVHGAHPRVAFEPVPVPVQKMPVEQIEGAGPFPCLFADAVVARLAVVRHAVDVSTAAHVRLGRDDTAVRELAHADRVRRFDPFESVGIDRKIPLMHPPRIDAREQSEIAGDHQTLDMVRVGVCAGLAYGLG